MKYLSSLIFMALFFSACSRPVEVPVELPIYDRPVCKGLNKVKLGETIVLGSDHGIDLNSIALKGFTLLILPVPQKRLDFEELYIYRKKEMAAYIKCDRRKDSLIASYEYFNKTSNDLRK